MVKALGAIIGILIVVVGFGFIVLSMFFAGFGIPTLPIFFLGLILTLIGFMVVIIAIIVYLCYQSPILVIPRG